MIPRRTPSAWIALVLAACFAPANAFGCAACFGRTDDALAKGMNAGIFAMLAFVVVMWVAFASFFVFIVRRARSGNEPLPGETEDPQHN